MKFDSWTKTLQDEDVFFLKESHFLRAFRGSLMRVYFMYLRCIKFFQELLPLKTNMTMEE